MSKKTQGLLIFGIGVTVMIVSLAADYVGIGAAGGIGWKQWLGAIVGLVMVLAGFWWGRSKAA